MVKLTRILGCVLLVVVLHVQTGQAQDIDPTKNDPREQPVTPYPAPLPAGSSSVLALNSPLGTTEQVQIAGNNRPLSGVQEPTLGPLVGARNFLVPSVSVMSQLATSSSASGFSQPTEFSYLLGTLDLNRVSERSELLVHYTGGGMISSYLNSAVQDLEFSYNYKWQRWSLLVGDQASYLSESPFGFGGIGGLAFVNGVLELGPTLNGSPSQTIPTIMVPRVSNSAVSQIEYKVSPRASWTASGSFGILNFLGAGFINSTDGTLQTGYNYALSPQSSVAVIYRFDEFRFTYLPERISSHVAQLGYGRYVTGRLSFHIAAGPSVEMLHGVVTDTVNRVSWAVDTGLSYQMDRTKLLLSYNHFVSGGSGVLVGAETGQVEATAERKLAPRWRGSASLGYANNQSLVPTTANSGRENYNSWYVAVRVNHELRPGTAFYLGYGARLQAVNFATCVTTNCGTSSVSHEISAGFNFGLRPILFR
jgi:hypothetical protein